MSSIVGILDINFFEGQARHSRGDPEILGEDPHVVANVRNGKIYSVNGAAKDLGLTRYYTLSEAKAQFNFHIIPVPLDNRGYPIRQDLQDTSRDFFYCIQNIRDDNNWDIPIEYGSQDEAYLDLSQQVESFMSDNSQPYINTKALHWNSYFELGSQQLSMSNLSKYGENKREFSINYPEAYYASFIMTKFIRGLKDYESLQVSAGLGQDRFFAKLASQLNDSNSLNYLNRDGLDRISQYLNINHIVGLKGRIGQDIKNAFGIETVEELREIPPSSLRNALGGDPDKTLEIRHKIFGNLPCSYKDNWHIKDMVFDNNFKF